MDSNAVVLDLLHYNIITEGDQKTITMTIDRTQQNKFLHLYLRKCTDDAFRLVCNIISNVKGNPKMSALGTAMERSLQKGNCLCVCECACMCVHMRVRCMLLNSPEWLGNSDMIEVRTHYPKESQISDALAAFRYFHQ